MADMITFVAGKGINANSLNQNFDTAKTDANTNETALGEIAETALLKDGSNLTQDIVDEFNKSEPNIITAEGDIPLTDNTENFLTLTGNGAIVLPTIGSDNFSHTISVMVMGSEFALDLGTTKHILNYLNLDPTETYNVAYTYNKLDNSWYYSLTQ